MHPGIQVIFRVRQETATKSNPIHSIFSLVNHPVTTYSDGDCDINKLLDSNLTAS